MVLYDSVADAVTMDNHKSRPEISEALFHESGSSMRTSDTLDERVYYYAVALKDGSILRVSSSMDSIFAMMLSMGAIHDYSGGGDYCYFDTDYPI